MKQGQVPRYKAGECSRCGAPEAKHDRETYCADCRAVKQAEYRERLRAKLERLKTLEALFSAKSSDTYQETA